MKKYNSKFEQRTYFFAVEIVKFVKNNDSFIQIHSVYNQLLRSGTSVAANVFEARSASSRKDFINFFSYALKSANETKFWLDLIFDSGISKEEVLPNLSKEITEISKILASSIITMKKKN